MRRMPARPRRSLLVLPLLVALAAPGVWAQSATPAAPTLDIAAQLEFLRTATVVSSRPIGKGVTGSKRVTLTDGTLTHDAAFQAVANEAVGRDVPNALRRSGELRFIDHYRFNLAAWRLAQVLGLGHMMPATVERTIGSPGALSWWVDDVLMDEEGRQKTNAGPKGGALELARQFARMSVFTELVRDTDRNKGNVVYTHDWRVMMLDFTRAFRLQASLRAPGLLAMCDRRLLAALKALTRDDVERAVAGALNGGEVKALMARRDLIVAHYERLVAARGEGAVLY